MLLWLFAVLGLVVVVVGVSEAVANILVAADVSGRELEDADVVAVLEGRTAYLVAIGAIGPEA